MSAAGGSLSEDQFLCSICLDVFTDPVSTPCGHNFYKKCITKHWDVSVQCQCPNCKNIFLTRPELQVNTFVSEMVSHFRQSAQQRASSSELRAAGPGEVPCDLCMGTKLMALKSCLVCLASYCETHLEPHLTRSGLRRHRLIDPVENLEDRMCKKHEKPLELFCKTDQTCVCMLCTVLDHKTHEVVALEEEYDQRMANLGKTEAKIELMIHERQSKIQEFKRSVKVSRDNADREIAASIQAFTKLKEVIERNQTKAIETTEKKHKTTEKQAEGFIKELEQEICELKTRRAELEQFSHSEDHFNFVQNCPSLNAPSLTKNWTEVKVCPPSDEGTVGAAVAQSVEMLQKYLKKLLAQPELTIVRLYAVDVTLDPETAHPQLILSGDGKQVHHDFRQTKNYQGYRKRYSAGLCVLGKQMFSSGRFYFEVQVKEKTDWTLGVARESVNRKTVITISPQNGYWTIGLMSEKLYSANTESRVALSLKSKPEKVGVFVDYEECLVSFYDTDTGSLIYTFSDCGFTDKLVPAFLPGVNHDDKNFTPLIICPVDHSKYIN